MGLNTYPSNPFPPSSAQIDAINEEIKALKSGLTNAIRQLSKVYFAVVWRGGDNYNDVTLKYLKPLCVGFILTKAGIFPFQTNSAGNGFVVESGVNLTITSQGNDVYRFACAGEWYASALLVFTWDFREVQ